jgi:hypothetical protein
VLCTASDRRWGSKGLALADSIRKLAPVLKISKPKVEAMKIGKKRA